MSTVLEPFVPGPVSPHGHRTLTIGEGEDKVVVMLCGRPDPVDKTVKLLTNGLPPLVLAVQSMYGDAEMALDGSWDVTGTGEISNDVRKAFESSSELAAVALGACGLDVEYVSKGEAGE